MKYNDLLKAHLTYGTKPEDIIKNKGYEKILETVVVAPWWSHDIFDKLNFKTEQINDKVFNLDNGEISFSYIELKRQSKQQIYHLIILLKLLLFYFHRLLLD